MQAKYKNLKFVVEQKIEPLPLTNKYTKGLVTQDCNI